MGGGPKHLQLIVPNYDQSGEHPHAPVNYFRMGADFQDGAEFPPQGARGDELPAGMQFKDEHRAPVRPGKTYPKHTGAEHNEGGVPYRTVLPDELVTR